MNRFETQQLVNLANEQRKTNELLQRLIEIMEPKRRAKPKADDDG